MDTLGFGFEIAGGASITTHYVAVREGGASGVGRLVAYEFFFLLFFGKT